MEDKECMCSMKKIAFFYVYEAPSLKELIIFKSLSNIFIKWLKETVVIDQGSLLSSTSELAKHRKSIFYSNKQICFLS